MRLLIGSPVLRREWIIAEWLEHTTVAANQAGVDYDIVMLGGKDDPTFAVLDQTPNTVARLYIDEPRQVDTRNWSSAGRLDRMVEIRNTLLAYVRQAQPDVYLSLDSDVLLHPSAIANLLETRAERRWEIVGGYCYMSQGRVSHPSYCDMPAPHVRRRPNIVGRVRRCDATMAIVSMGPAAYAVDYKFDPWGEDLGIARQWNRRGFITGVDARVVNKHVMSREMLHRVDPRVGW